MRISGNTMAALIIGVTGFASTTQAAPFAVNGVVDGFTFLGEFGGNDCGGPGQKGSFSTCVATQTGVGKGHTGALPASVIYKFGLEEEEGSFGNYGQISGNEFAMSLSDDKVFNWTYDPDAGDPLVHYFSIKQGNGHALFYSEAGGSSWTGDVRDGLGYNAVNHVSWFNGSLFQEAALPVPPALPLFAIGLTLLGLSRRRYL